MNHALDETSPLTGIWLIRRPSGEEAGPWSATCCENHGLAGAVTFETDDLVELLETARAHEQRHHEAA